MDVIGRPDAAAIGRTQPGRGLARFGQDEVVAFQTALVSTVGGDGEELPATRPFRLIADQDNTAAAVAGAEGGATDLDLLVDAVTSATTALGHRKPRSPWPEPLPRYITFEDLATRDDETRVGGATSTFGLTDEPHR